MIARRLTVPNLLATLALFFSLGGVGYAATQLPKNSVGARQLKRNAVTTAKLKNEAVTGAKINLSSVGPVANAAQAARADVALSADLAASVPAVPLARAAKQLPPLEAAHVVGTSGQPLFGTGWATAGTAGTTFYKDRQGFVHLSGEATKLPTAGGTIYVLPLGFQPEADLTFLVQGGADDNTTTAASIKILPNGAVTFLYGNNGFVSFDGVVFRPSA